MKAVILVCSIGMTVLGGADLTLANSPTSPIYRANQVRPALLRNSLYRDVRPASAPAVLSSTTPSASTPSSSPTEPAALTFQAWKTLRMEEARFVLERLMMETQIQEMQQTQNAPMVDRAPGERQAVIRSAPSASSEGNISGAALPTARIARHARVDARTDNRQIRPESRSETKVEQARINLEIANELTITDYLQIYLSQFRSPDVLRDVARRMAAEDVAELLMAYQQKSASLGSVGESSLAASRLCSGTAASRATGR